MQQENDSKPGVETGVSASPTAASAMGDARIFNRNFTLLTVGQSISLTGDAFYITTIILWVYTLTQAMPGSAATKAALTAAVTGAGYGAFYLGGLLVPPLAGVFVDRWNRRVTMLIATLCQTVVCLLPLLTPLISSSLRIPTMILSVFLLAGIQAVFTSAQSGLLQAIVSRERLPQGVSTLQILTAGGGILGAALAAPLFLALGPTIAILFDSFSFVISAICLLLIRASREALHPYAFRQTTSAASLGAGHAILNVLVELVQGFRYVLSTRLLLIAVFSVMVAELGGGALATLSTLIFTHRLHGSVTFYGLFSSLLSLGTMLGALLAGLLARRVQPRYLMVGSLFLMGLSLLIYSLETQVVIGSLTYFLIGFFQGGFVVGFFTLIVKTAPGVIVGRTQSSMATFQQAIGLVASILAGILGGLVALNFIIVGGALLLVLAGSLGFLALRALGASSGQPAMLDAAPELEG